MHSQDRILILPVTGIGMSGRFLQKLLCITLAVILTSQVSYSQCPPDTADTEAPTCLTNQVIEIVLGPTECQLVGTIANTLIPLSGPDNCDLSPTSSGLVQPTLPVDIGSQVLEYTVSDVTGNLQTCFVTLIVEQFGADALICAETINHSLDPTTCTGTISLQEVINANEVNCPESCVVTIMEMDGTPRDDVFVFEDVGKKFQYQLCCGVTCCWGYVNVEYKGSQSFNCPSDVPVVVTSSCIEMNDIPPPDLGITNQCLPPRIELVSQIENNTDCSTNVQKELIRTYQIISAQGTVHDECVQIIQIIAADLNNIIEPPKAPLIGCDDEVSVDSTGAPFYYTALDAMGVPVDTFSLAPGEFPINCSVFSNFEDTVIDAPCGELIMRRWTIAQWACGVEDMRTFIQRIEVSDINPPVVDCPSDTLRYTTNTADCQSAVTLPSITATDDCSDDLMISIATPGGPVNDNGGLIILPTDTFDIVYSISDCANTTLCDVTVVVSDMTPPVAICETSIKIGFGEVGGTFLSAYKLDGGSYDDCDDVSFLIARMDDDLALDAHPYDDKILIECTDVDTTFMAILQVSDKLGNISYCMGEVCVEDNKEGEITCPPAITVECNIPFDNSNLSPFFGEFSISDNCPDRYEIEDFLRGSLNDCGVGQLIRTIRLRNRSGDFVDQCRQFITFEDGDPLVIPPNTFRPIIEREACRIPNPVLNFTPNIPTDDCNLIGISSTIDTIKLALEGEPSSVNNTCREFLRTWKIIDWCAVDGPGSKAEPFVFEQQILLSDNIGPTFARTPMDSMICNSSADCDSIFLSLPAPLATDNCGDIIAYDYVIRKDNAFYADGTGDLIEGNFAVGDYTFRWIAFDGCGNFGAITDALEIKVCKAPTLSCLAGISAPIRPVDTDGDDKPDVNIVVLETKQFIAAAFHPCGLDVEVSFEDQMIVDQLILDCDDIGEDPVAVEIYAIDSNGNSSHCTSFVAISDNDLCPEVPSGGLVNVQGRIQTTLAQDIMNVEVALDGDSKASRMTSGNGSYLFASMPSGGAYQIKPTKSDDYLNGVSITDLILIQQHILGLNTLTNPYLLLAADVNKDQRITIMDLIVLQQIILGYSDKPANDESWLFVDSSYEFSDTQQPFAAAIPSSYTVDELKDDLNINFTGIKYADLDGSALTQSENRGHQLIHLQAENQFVLKNQTIELPVYAQDAIDFRGLQLELSTTSLRIDKITSDHLSIEDSYLTRNNLTQIILPVAQGEAFNQDKPLFTLHLTATKTIELKDALDVVNNSEMILTSAFEKYAVGLNILDEDHNFAIQEVRPNPWYDYTSIRYSDTQAGLTKIHITDTEGRTLYQLTKPHQAGQNQFKISKDILPHPGVYFIHIGNGKSSATEKMIKLE